MLAMCGHTTDADVADVVKLAMAGLVQAADSGVIRVGGAFLVHP